ncbi:MAG: hypothetical protein K2X50_04390 [Gammaproteobacteria bacterium]|nr:hypothetical protein [Gammaproteobacteria bacterium]
MKLKTPALVEEVKTPLLEHIDYLPPLAWLTRVLLDPSITSSYNEPEFQDKDGKLVDSTGQAHLSVASEDNEHDFLLGQTANETAETEAERELRPLIPRIKAYLTYVAKKVFVETYEFDGLHLSDATYTGADGTERVYPDDELTSSMIAWTIFGFPNRPQWLKGHFRELVHDRWTILKNMFGSDIHPDPKQYRLTGKKIGVGTRLVLLIGILVEALFIKTTIFLIKAIEIIPKIALNIFKFVTEYIPSFLKNVTGTLIGQTTKNIALTTELYNMGKLSVGYLIGGYLVFGIATLMLAPIHYAFRFATIATTAFASPLKSAKAAWALGSSFVIHEKLGNFNYIPVVLMGSIFLAASIALSSALWAIALPLVFTGLTSLFPALTGVINGLLASPFVASSWATINTAIASAWSYVGLTAAFAYASSALATYMGIHIAASTLAVGVATALVATPTVIFAARIVEAFSNGWARLNQMSFRSAFFPVFFAPEKDGSVHGHNHHHGHGEEVNLQEHPSRDTYRVVGNKNDSVEEVDNAAHNAHRFGSAVDGKPHTKVWAYNPATKQLTVDGRIPTTHDLDESVNVHESDATDSVIKMTVTLPNVNDGYFNLTFVESKLIKCDFRETKSHVMEKLRSPVKTLSSIN